MHPYKQLLRQPLRTLAALIILTASIAFMCLSWGVYRSGLATAKAVDEGFVTIMEYDNDYLMNNKVILETDVYDSMTGRYESAEWEVPLSYGLKDNGTFDKIAEALPLSDCFDGYYTSRYANALIPGYVPVISSVERYSFK